MEKVTGAQKRINEVTSGFRQLVNEGKIKNFEVHYNPNVGDHDDAQRTYSQAYLTALAISDKPFSYDKFEEILSQQVCHDVEPQVGAIDIKVENLLDVYDVNSNIKAVNPKQAPLEVNFLSGMCAVLDHMQVTIERKRLKTEMSADFHVSYEKNGEHTPNACLATDASFSENWDQLRLIPHPIRKHILGVVEKDGKRTVV